MQYAANKACRWMARLRVQDVVGVKKLARFLHSLGQVKWVFRWQSEEEASRIREYVDSDWAVCRRTRRSTSGGMLEVSSRPLRTWSTTQPTIATSPKAELIGMPKEPREDSG